MICEHRETGLRIIVKEIRHTKKVVETNGRETTIEIGRAWQTEAGQFCEPFGPDTIHDSDAIIVLTPLGRIMVSMVDPRM